MTAYPAAGNTSDSKHWRIVEMMVFQPAPQISGMFTASYADKTNMYGGDDKTNHWNNSTQWEVGIRPAYHFSDYFKVSVEAGYQASTSKEEHADAGNGQPKETVSMWKATVAPTITPAAGPAGAFFTRPELRLFVTYASFDEKNPSWVFNDGIMNSNLGTTYSEGSGLTFGAQVEAWF
ncbi:MAG: carbohydrate porin [Anaeromyxobacter sp.]